MLGSTYEVLLSPQSLTGWLRVPACLVSLSGFKRSLNPGLVAVIVSKHKKQEELEEKAVFGFFVYSLLPALLCLSLHCPPTTTGRGR